MYQRPNADLSIQTSNLSSTTGDFVDTNSEVTQKWYVPWGDLAKQIGIPMVFGKWSANGCCFAHPRHLAGVIVGVNKHVPKKSSIIFEEWQVDHVRCVIFFGQHSVYLRFAMGWWRVTWRSRRKCGHELTIIWMRNLAGFTWCAEITTQCSFFFSIYVPPRHHRRDCLVPWWLIRAGLKVCFHPRNQERSGGLGSLTVVFPGIWFQFYIGHRHIWHLWVTPVASAWHPCPEKDLAEFVARTCGRPEHGLWPSKGQESRSRRQGLAWDRDPLPWNAFQWANGLPWKISHL